VKFGEWGNEENAKLEKVAPSSTSLENRCRSTTGEEKELLANCSNFVGITRELHVRNNREHFVIL
jgi:hypothetical protein